MAAFGRLVNYGNVGGATTTVLAVDATGYTAGTLLSLGGYHRNTAVSALSSVSDSKGNTWQVDVSNGSAATGEFVASSYLTTPLVSGDTITITYTTATNGQSAIQLLSFSGMASATWRDVSASAANGGPTTAGPSVTTTVDDIVVTFYGTTAAVTESSTTWTSTGSQSAQSGPTRCDSVYTRQATPATINASLTYSGSNSGPRQIAVAYKVGTGTDVTVVAVPVKVNVSMPNTLSINHTIAAPPIVVNATIAPPTPIMTVDAVPIIVQVLISAPVVNSPFGALGTSVSGWVRRKLRQHRR